MARSHCFAHLELHSYPGRAELAGGLGHRVLAKPGWDAERVDCAPGPEWTAAECQAVLSRWYRGQPVRSHDAAAFIDDQRASDEQFDVV